jgi:hypothetical protein
MSMKTNFAADEDVRLELFLGIANWFIFLDHIPHNAVNLITPRNFGFSGAADLFIFIFGYTAAIVYAKMIRERGFIVGATRIFKRVWQLYVTYVVLFAIYIVTIGDVATRYAAPDLLYEFNVAVLVDHPIRTVGHGLILQSRVLNLDVLQLYIVLMAFLVPVLWAMLRRPGLAMAGSVALYFAARQFEWNLPSFPDGEWYFNPFCWQLLFVFGVWVALGEGKGHRFALKSPVPVYFAVCTEALARSGMAGVQAPHQMRPAIARRVLCRGVPFLCRPSRPDDEFGFAVRSSVRERERHRDHDPRRLLHLMVPAAGSPAGDPVSHGIARRAPVTSQMWLVVAARRNIRQPRDLFHDQPRKEATMKLMTIALAGALALSSTFALAQAGGSAGGSSTAGGSATSGTTTGSSTSGTTTGSAAGQSGTGSNGMSGPNTMSPSGSTVGARPSPSGSTLTPTGPGSGLSR